MAFEEEQAVKKSYNLKKILIVAGVIFGLFVSVFFLMRKDTSSNPNEKDKTPEFSGSQIPDIKMSSNIPPASKVNFTATICGKYILVESSTLTWEKFIKALKNENDVVRKDIENLLNSVNSKGVLLEFKPFSWNTSTTDRVEFRIIIDNDFDYAVEDKGAFANQFPACKAGTEDVICFKSSLNNSLVSPCPFSESGNTISTHFKIFMETASEDHKRKLLHMVGEELEKESKANRDKGIWLSTHGKGTHGVKWLHVRVCLHPYYYVTEEYKTFRT